MIKVDSKGVYVEFGKSTSVGERAVAIADIMRVTHERIAAVDATGYGIAVVEILRGIIPSNKVVLAVDGHGAKSHRTIDDLTKERYSEV